MLGWTLRDLVSSFSGRVEALLASAVGLLTVLSWVLGDDSPLDTLDHGAQWLGVNISNALANIGVWLNADHRQAAFIGACLIIFWVALLRQARCWWDYWPAFEMAEKRGLREEYMSGMYRSERRFWAIAWVLAGVVAVLHAGSWGTALAYFVVIAVVHGLAELRDPTSPWWHKFSYGVLESFEGAVQLLVQLPWQLYEAVFVPSGRVNQEKPVGAS